MKIVCGNKIVMFPFKGASYLSQGHQVALVGALKTSTTKPPYSLSWG